MKTDETETSSTSASGLKSAAEKKTTWLSSTLWWTKVAQVRFRFVLIIVAAGLVVTQWAAVSNLWDRFVLRPVGLNAAAEISSGHEYFCPMDPGVISVWPAICPICNMDLVPRKKMDAVLLPEGVLSRMQLSPYRIQLAGIKTTQIEPRELFIEQSFLGVLHQFEDGRVGFTTSLSDSDVLAYSQAHPARMHGVDRSANFSATVQSEDGSATPLLRCLLNEPSSLKPGSFVTVNISRRFGKRTNSRASDIPVLNPTSDTALGPISMGTRTQSDIPVLNPTSDTGETAVPGPMLCVPETAVIDRGHERLVYVESMPGMFDCVAVELGQRCGGYYPVIHGLKAGQRVATAGAFLIDAETRLNPSLASGYFGASPTDSSSSPAKQDSVPSTGPPITRSVQPKRVLSTEDKLLVAKQRICPVTELPLDSMGGPVPVLIAGRKVFICCAGCEQRLKDEPDKYLVRLTP